MRYFTDRVAAGRELAADLAGREFAAPVVLGLPRGGVPVAAEVAAALGATLDVLVVRKVGAPGHAEVAMGAVGEGGTVVGNEDVIRAARVEPEQFDRARRRQDAEVERRMTMFRAGRAGVDLAGRTAIVVDDGIATGATARAACAVARARGAAHVVLAVPVGPADREDDLDADEVICLHEPADFQAVGQYYVDFRQVEDAEVIALLAASA